MFFPDKVARELREKSVRQADSCGEFTHRILEIVSIPCKIPCWQGICLETGAISTASPASAPATLANTEKSAWLGS
jgi:hypothetical protein